MTTSPYLAWLASTFAHVGSPRAPDAAGDLVLGCALGYDAGLVAPFVRSLRRHYAGPVVLIVDSDPALADFLAEHRIEGVTPEPKTRWTPHPAMARYGWFDGLLRDWTWVDRVLLTDVRDVVFQGDPFRGPSPELEVFAEDDGRALGAHAFNMKHLRAIAGRDLASTLAERPSLCVGTMIGSRAAVRRMCRVMLSLAAIPRSAAGGAFGADQAACNLAVHLGLVEAAVSDNFRRVATVGLTPSDRLAVRDGQLVNPDGSVSPIVHQYDRHPDLARLLHERWGTDAIHCARRRPDGLGPRLSGWRRSVVRRWPEMR